MGRLRSGAAVTRRPWTNLGRQAFPIAGPSVWNSLPQSLRLIDDHEQFRKQLKTLIYRRFYLTLIGLVYVCFNCVTCVGSGLLL